MTQYFFHILDGSELFADELGKSFSNSEEAINQAKCLAAELSKAGDFCRSNLVLAYLRMPGFIEIEARYLSFNQPDENGGPVRTEQTSGVASAVSVDSG